MYNWFLIIIDIDFCYFIMWDYDVVDGDVF